MSNVALQPMPCPLQQCSWDVYVMGDGDGDADGGGHGHNVELAGERDHKQPGSPQH